jgi:hypothetical protein
MPGSKRSYISKLGSRRAGHESSQSLGADRASFHWLKSLESSAPVQGCS